MVFLYISCILTCALFFLAPRKMPFFRDWFESQRATLASRGSREGKALCVDVRGHRAEVHMLRHCNGFPLTFTEEENEPLKKQKPKLIQPGPQLRKSHNSH